MVKKMPVKSYTGTIDTFILGPVLKIPKIKGLPGSSMQGSAMP
jgi:hypothetical protein